MNLTNRKAVNVRAAVRGLATRGVGRRYPKVVNHHMLGCPLRRCAVFAFAMLLGTGAHAAEKFAPSIRGVEPLRSRMSDVRRFLGRAPLSRDVSQADEAAPVVLCYVSGPPRTYLVVESGAAGDFGDRVTAFKLTVEPPHHLQPIHAAGTGKTRAIGNDELCRVSKAVHRKVRLSNGLMLGMTVQDVEALLGPADSIRGSDLLYSRRRARVPESADTEVAHAQFSWMVVTADAGRVSGIEVERSDLE